MDEHRLLPPLGQAAGVGRGFNLDAQLAAEQAARLLQDGGGKPILVSSELYQQPQMAYALGKAQLQTSFPRDVIDAATSALPVLHQEQFDQRQPMYLVWKDGDMHVQPGWSVEAGC